MPHRTDIDRGHLLHRAERRLLPSGPDVVGGTGWRGGILDVARAHDRLPRRRARPSPAGGPDRVPPRTVESVAPPGLVDLWARRGLGALRRTFDGRPWLSRRSGRLPRDARRSVDAGGARRHRHRRALRVPRTGGGRRRTVDLRIGLAIPARARIDGSGVPAFRTRPVSRLAGPGPVVQDRRAALAAVAGRRAGQ